MQVCPFFRLTSVPFSLWVRRKAFLYVFSMHTYALSKPTSHKRALAQTHAHADIHKERHTHARTHACTFLYILSNTHARAPLYRRNTFTHTKHKSIHMHTRNRYGKESLLLARQLLQIYFEMAYKRVWIFIVFAFLSCVCLLAVFALVRSHALTLVCFCCDLASPPPSSLLHSCLRFSVSF